MTRMLSLCGWYGFVLLSVGLALAVVMPATLRAQGTTYHIGGGGVLKSFNTLDELFGAGGPALVDNDVEPAVRDLPHYVQKIGYPSWYS